MSPPIPVPSKAAIRALRGLALGTSCALGLIVEDRRRRISTLRTAVDNKKKLRTSRNYHGSAVAVQCAGDDAVVLSGDGVHWHYQDEPPRASQRDQNINEGPQPLFKKATAQEARDLSDAVPVTEQNEKSTMPEAEDRSLPQPVGKAKPSIPRLSAVVDIPKVKDSGGWASTPTVRATPAPYQIIAEISKLSVSAIDEILREPGAFATYNAAFVAACQTKSAFKQKANHQWLNVSEALCTYCRANGLWQDSQEILAAVVNLGEIDESRYYAHGPISVIGSLLATLETDADSRAKRLHLAVHLFLAKFEEQPKLHADEILELGKSLISQLVQFDQIHLVQRVFWRTLGQQEHPEEFTAWFIQALFDYSDYKSVVKHFKLNFSKMAPDLASFNTTVELVLDSVEAMRGAQAEQVARALGKQCDDTGLQPQAGWLIRLLQSHWNRHKDLQKSRDFFNEFLSLDLMEKIDEPEEVYQIMVKLSVLAGDHVTARHYYQETIMLVPRMQQSVWLNGYMTLMKAKNGAWDAVYNDFSRMRSQRDVQHAAYNQTFVAVLKIFIENHTITEVEDFIKLYMKDMGVRLHRYVVTLVANKYGEIHDHKGFMGWLGYCSSQGFTLDPAFSNAVLRNFRLKWKFPYAVLRELYAEMRKLDTASVDDVTTRIMHGAAMEEGNYAGTSIRQRVRTLGTSPSKLPYFFKSANERDVLHAMTEEVLRGKPVKAVVIYKRALRFGMPWCPKCFRVAVKASLQQEGDNFGMTIRLISESHENGHDVAQAAAVFIKAQLNQFRGPFEEVMANLQNLIIRFESIGLAIDPSVLTQAAIMSAQFGQFDQAVSLCKLAMEKSGATNPCFSRQSLRVLLLVYWQTLDTTGMRWIAESLPSSPLAGDKTAFQLLKSTMRHMAKWESSSRVDEMIEILQGTLYQARQHREAQIEVGTIMYNETIRIMRDAAGALDAGKRQYGDRGSHDTRIEGTSKTPPPNMEARAAIEAYG
ncbi:hypothetical protein SCUP234_02822 [Seiridium cupressi]